MEEKVLPKQLSRHHILQPVDCYMLLLCATTRGLTVLVFQSVQHGRRQSEEEKQLINNQ